jgi:hypothetical protein
VQAGASQAEVEVEPYVLPTGAGTEVGGEPTAAANGGTPSGTLEEHYRMEQPHPSSSWFPCGHG